MGKFTDSGRILPMKFVYQTAGWTGLVRRTPSFFRRPWAVDCALAGLILSISTSTFGQQVYALEFNQANNLFGTINLLTGGFTQLGTEGGTLFNDIADAPNGTLYGIVNTAQLVTLNPNNGAVLTRTSLNVGGIEWLALS